MKLPKMRGEKRRRFRLKIEGKKKLWQLICGNVIAEMEGKKIVINLSFTISATWLPKFFFFFTNIKILEIKKMGQ